MHSFYQGTLLARVVVVIYWWCSSDQLKNNKYIIHLNNMF